MAAPSSTDEFLELVRKSGVLEEKRLSAHLDKLRAAGPIPPEAPKMAGLLVRDGLLTHFQAEQFLQGKWRRFTIGKYKVLELIASGGMGKVYLCEHKFMRRRAAVKILPTSRSNDPSALERFYREARAVAALDHPNIVRAYDIDQDENLHFLVMEYVDGSSLQDIVKKSGPLDPVRSGHYISQAALGLQHAHEVAGLVHRDIKPGNLIVDRGGTVKILDMGLARFFNDQDDLLTLKHDENVLGTADYLAPEQALDSHNVDIRADVYSLGATFYYCLTGKTPFSEGTVAQKLIWHQTRQPKPVRSLRRDVPEGMIAIIEKMMAKDPDQRYQLPIDVAQALTPWTQSNIAPPAETEMPQLSAAAMVPAHDFNFASAAPVPAATGTGTVKTWEIPENPPNSGSAPAPQSSGPDNLQSLSGEATTRVEKLHHDERPQPPTIVARMDRSSATDETHSSVSALTASSPQIEEESIPWEKLAAQTKDQIGELDTDSSSSNKVPARRKSGRKSRMSEAEQRRLWWVVGGVSAAAMLVLVVVFCLAFWGDPSRQSKEEQQRVTPARLIVSRAGQKNTFPTIREAVARARPFDHIVLADAAIVEKLILNEVRNLTIEAAPGVTVVWSSPEHGPNSNELLYLNQCEGLQIQGIAFDGRDQVDEIVQLFGNCPGLSLKNLELRGFKKYGILLANCAGKPGKQVSIENVRVTAAKDADAGLAFVAHPNVVTPKLNEYIVVRDCRFEGDYTKPVMGDASALARERVDWKKNTYMSKKDSSPKPLPLP